LIQGDVKKNEDRKKQNEDIESYNQAVKEGQVPGPEKPLRQLIEGVPSGRNSNQRNGTALANELIQSNGVINGEITNQAEANQATKRELTDSVPKATALINDPNKAGGDAARFVDNILKPKP